MHLVYVLAPAGGPEAYVQTLLPALAAAGHRVSVVYLAPPTCRPPFPASVQVRHCQPGNAHYWLHKLVGPYRAWAPRLKAWEVSRAVYSTLEKIDAGAPIDVVELLEGIPLGPLSRPWCTVVRAHGSAWTFRRFCRDGDARGDHFLVRQEAQQLTAAAAVSPISQHLAGHLAEACRLPLEHFTIIPYPVDTQRFAPPVAGAASRRLSLITAGRLEPRKGQAVLIRALAQTVWKQYPDLTLNLLGSEAGFTRQALLSLAPPDQQKNLHFPGFVPHSHIAGCYRQSALCIAPTQFETFGYTVLEAMACGLPVIASAVGAIPELVEDGVTGVLVPYGDTGALGHAILDLLRDPQRRAAMGRAARQKVLNRYTPERVLPELLAFYETALAAHGAKGPALQ